MNKSNIDLLKMLFTLEQSVLHKYLFEFLQDVYGAEQVIETEGKYMIAKGDIDVLLVSHLDTVHKKKPTLNDIFYDQERQVMIAPFTGIGADDRCGVFIIMNLVLAGYRPHIAFTWDEEIGGVGARYMVSEFDMEASNVTPNFAIEFDRRGHQQAVYYDLDNKDFEDYISSFGYTTHFGSYTDICEICPAWGFAGVNLSAGYQNEHTFQELVLVDTIMDTIEKSKSILEDQMKNPHFYGWKERSKQFSSYYNSSWGYYYPREDEEEEDYYKKWRSSKKEKNEQDFASYDYCDYCGTEKELNSIQDNKEWGGKICTSCYDFIYNDYVPEEKGSFYKQVVKEASKNDFK